MTCAAAFGLNRVVTGHLFVLRGDLTQLKCDAILVPCDGAWNVVWDHWSALLQEREFDRDSGGGARLKGSSHEGNFCDVAPSGERIIRLVMTTFGIDGHQGVADVVGNAITELSKILATHRGRAKPLVALPLVGTGAGGLQHRRGELIKALLPALTRVAHAGNVDVALVLFDDRDHAAVQSQRPTSHWDNEGFDVEQLQYADQLGERAAQKELSLFLGSGVSVPLGLPDWERLLADVGNKAMPTFSATDAPRAAQEIADEIGTERFKAEVAKRLLTTGFAPAHLLLAALKVRQSITTNFDTAYETALTSRLGEQGYRVLTRQSAAQPKPWLLKIHGDVGGPETIVITSNDYATLSNEHRSLHAVVESLLLTSHVVFVGYSMGDPDFVESVERVRTVRSLAENGSSEKFATVLALDAEAVVDHSDFNTISMLPDRDFQQAARLLEIFLDRVSWSASRHGEGSHSYLLDSNYEDLLATDHGNTRLRDLLKDLNNLPEDDPARTSTGWKFVEQLLIELGGRPRRPGA